MGHESSTITERRYIHLFDKQRTDDAVREAMAEASTPSTPVKACKRSHERSLRGIVSARIPDSVK